MLKNVRTRSTALLSRGILWLLLALTVGPAYSDVLIYPTRLVLEEGDRAAKLELINRGSEPATFRIRLVNRRMNEFGEFSPAEPPLENEKVATNLVRYSPRQVRIEPGQGQTVRLAVRKPANLASGEYRSHLLFEKQPEVTGSSSVEQLHGEARQDIQVKLETLVGVSIPVIVRHNTSASNVTLSNLTIENPATESSLIRFDIARSGEQSVYGDITVSLNSAGNETEIARARGVAVYYPNTLRIARLVLPASGQPLQPGDRISVRFTTPVDQGETLLAEAEVTIP